MTINWMSACAYCKRIRKEKGFTQKDVSKLSGYSQQCISKFESGKNDSGTLMLFYLFNFDISLEELTNTLQVYAKNNNKKHVV